MSIIEKIRAVDHKPTAEIHQSVVAPQKPFYSGFGRFWFVDWKHPDAKNFKPIKLK